VSIGTITFYQCSLLTQSGGSETLSSFDTAAHQALVDENGFKNVVVPEMSRSLTRRLSKALAPLFDSRRRKTTIEKLKPSLRSLLRIAIHIRQLSLVGHERYEAIWPRTGSRFDNDGMETVSAETNMKATVRLPMCPGLRAYPTQGNAVSYTGFETRDELHVPVKYVIKATIHGEEPL
jgi:hypothetical protein